MPAPSQKADHRASAEALDAAGTGAAAATGAGDGATAGAGSARACRGGAAQSVGKETGAGGTAADVAGAKALTSKSAGRRTDGLVGASSPKRPPAKPTSTRALGGVGTGSGTCSACGGDTGGASTAGVSTCTSTRRFTGMGA